MQQSPPPQEPLLQTTETAFDPQKMKPNADVPAASRLKRKSTREKKLSEKAMASVALEAELESRRQIKRARREKATKQEKKQNESPDKKIDRKEREVSNGKPASAAIASSASASASVSRLSAAPEAATALSEPHRRTRRRGHELDDISVNDIKAEFVRVIESRLPLPLPLFDNHLTKRAIYALKRVMDFIIVRLVNGDFKIARLTTVTRVFKSPLDTKDETSIRDSLRSMFPECKVEFDGCMMRVSGIRMLAFYGSHCKSERTGAAVVAATAAAASASSASAPAVALSPLLA